MALCLLLRISRVGVAPNVAQWDKDEYFPLELVARLGRCGSYRPVGRNQLDFHFWFRRTEVSVPPRPHRRACLKASIDYAKS